MTYIDIVEPHNLGVLILPLARRKEEKERKEKENKKKEKKKEKNFNFFTNTPLHKKFSTTSTISYNKILYKHPKTPPSKWAML